ncbi:MAG: Wzy polymerase domain-containing protein [Pseudomonadota bacterium]
MPSSPGTRPPTDLQRAGLPLAAMLLLMVPWLNPFAPGPSPALTPWLVALLCATLLLMLAPFVSVQVIARAWLAAALVSAVAGLLQYAGWAGPFAPWVNQTAPGEAFGNLRQRNQFASLMSIGLAVLVWHSLARDSGNRRWVPAALAALLAAASAASASRTGLVQLALICVLAVLWHPASRARAWRLAASALLAYMLATVLLPLLLGLSPASQGVFARIAEDSAPCTSRLTLWANVLQLIAQRPWAGWGWGELDYAHFAHLYTGERFCDILDNAHNLPLQLAVELGVPVAALLCGAAAWLVLRAAPWRETQPVRQLAWAVLLVIGVHSMLEYPLWYGPFLTAALLCLAMLWTHPAAGPGGAVPPQRRGRMRWRLPLVFILLPALCYAAWDYWRIGQIYTPPDARAPAYRANTLEKLRASWLFADQVRFAELTMSPVTRANARAMHALATAAVHYSPEPAVVERLIESAVMLDRDDEAIVNLARYKAAFPKEHAAWAEANLRAVQKAPSAP